MSEHLQKLMEMAEKSGGDCDVQIIKEVFGTPSHQQPVLIHHYPLPKKTTPSPSSSTTSLLAAVQSRFRKRRPSPPPHSSSATVNDDSQEAKRKRSIYMKDLIRATLNVRSFFLLFDRLHIAGPFFLFSGP